MNTLDEPIRVATVFSEGKILPVWFEWKRKRHPVDTITYSWHERRGTAQVRSFSVLSGGVLYYITFDSETFAWRLRGLEE